QDRQRPAPTARTVPAVVLLLVLLPGLSILAHATPADPVWIAGIYDDADYDDVVWLVTNTQMLDQPVTTAIASHRVHVAALSETAISVAAPNIPSVVRPRPPPPA